MTISGSMKERLKKGNRNKENEGGEEKKRERERTLNDNSGPRRQESGELTELLPLGLLIRQSLFLLL